MTNARARMPPAALVAVMVQQASCLGNFIASLVAWVRHRAGGWQWTWVVTDACSLAGIGLAVRWGRLQGAGGRAG